jgi:hypothetical protein
VTTVGITERTASGIVTDLTAAGYVVKHKDGRRSRYQIQAHMPQPEPTSQLTGGNPAEATTASRTAEAASRGH